MTSLPAKPAFSGHCEDAPRPYKGNIEVGMVFAWEPTLPHARELILVTAISLPHLGEEALIHTETLSDDSRTGQTFSNTEDRFREAVVPTMFNKMKPR